MSNSRTLHVSLDYLTAELTAFPFVSRQGIEAALSWLDPHLRGLSGIFWRKVESHFLRRFADLSLDELISMRNRVWFEIDPRTLHEDSRSPRILLHRVLRATANEWLVMDGIEARPRLTKTNAISDAHEPAARRAWRWFMFAMPPDLMLAGLGRETDGPVRINLISPAVMALLRSDGFAETHLHMGAAFDFPTAWASLVNVAGREDVSGQSGLSCTSFCSPGADHREGLDLAQWLIRACVVRYLLASHLCHSSYGVPFLEFLDDYMQQVKLSHQLYLGVRESVRDLLGGRLSAISDSSSEPECHAVFLRLQQAYNALTRVSTFSPASKLDDVQSLDPLRKFFRNFGHDGPSIQLQYLRKGLEYLESHPDDEGFAKLFWQVERIRGQVYRHCVQRPLTPGLMNFIRVYDRKSPLLKLANKLELESSAKLSGVELGLRSLEVRMSPKGNADLQRSQIGKLIQGIKSLRHHYVRRSYPVHSGWSTLEIGLVLHFLKSRGEKADDGYPSGWDLGNHADPSIRSISEGNRSDGFRWRTFFLKQLRHADAIAGTIERDPSLLGLLRGLDVCRDEHGVPCWIVSLLYQRVRTRVNERLLKLGREKRKVHPLRTTAHTGEDFVHLATGLRYMDEAIEHLGLKQGDRIGHGLALGMRADQWASDRSRIAMPIEDRWFDLIWERRLHSVAGSRFTNDRRAFIEDEIVRLTEWIFDGANKQNHWTVAEATKLASWLYDMPRLRRVGFFSGRLSKTEPRGLERELERYLTEPAVYRRCRSTEWICVQHDSDALVESQRIVRKRYADIGITIEVNPISNLLIGNLTDMESHPLWQLAPGLGNDNGSTLRICVGSDDPLPFSTTLPEEYQFLYDALVLAGRSQAEARTWLQMVVRLSMESRFTLPADRLTTSS